MKTVAKKSNNQKSNRAIANFVSQQKSNGQDALKVVNNQEVSISQAGLRLIIDNSPRTVAQRKKLARAFGMPVQWKDQPETDICVESGQAKHPAHNAWHMVQEKQGEVKPIKNIVTNIGSKIIQREISEEQFIEDTTSSILWCIKWRSGDAQVLARMQQRLRIYENAREVVARVQALEDVYENAQRMRADRSSKLYRALMRIKVEAPQVINQLKQDPAYQEYEKGLKVQEALAQEEKERRLLGTPYADATVKERNLRLAQYRRQHPDYAFLIEGMDGTMSEAQVLKHLVDNFFGRTDFTYTFNASSPFKGVGDCQTLRNEYIQVARDALGIALDRGDTDTPAYVEGGRKIIDKNGLTGNVDNGSHWLFENHHWGVWKGMPIDILYGLYGTLQASAPAQLVENAPLLYYKSGKTRIYVARERRPGNSYTLYEKLAMANPYYKE
jgi:hypothetical protein